MKSFGMLSVMAIAVSGWMTSYGQAMEAEVPGDHFSLEGALELFKKSESPEEFEKMLNSPESKVNNLDLDGDGYIDYIRVLDRQDGNVHAFILQAVLSRDQYQDVAVIELEKLANGRAVLQIVGDEDVYGVETIIEPTREVRTYAGTTTTHTVVNVWAWPSVQYIYGPYYSVWVSPWRWHYHPVWWSPWRPVTYVHYYHYWRPYYDYYVPCHTRRIAYAYEIYRPYRSTSVIFRDRHHRQVTHYRSRYDDGYRYRNDYDRDRDRGDRSDGGDRYTRGRDDGGQRRNYTPDNNFDRSRNNSADRQRTYNYDANVNRKSSAPAGVNTSPQRDASRDRRAPASYQRSASPSTRDDFTYRGAGGGNSQSREMRTDNRGENRSSSNPGVQRRSTTERSNPVYMPRTSAPVKQSDFNRGRSGAVQSDRGVQRQAAPASVNRSRSSGGDHPQQRSGSRGGSNVGGKRGRD